MASKQIRVKDLPEKSLLPIEQMQKYTEQELAGLVPESEIEDIKKQREGYYEMQVYVYEKEYESEEYNKEVREVMFCLHFVRILKGHNGR